MPCPFSPSKGFSTEESRREFIAIHTHEKDKEALREILDDHRRELDPNDFPESFEADLDINAPLYFWQLFSIIGQEPIIKLVTTFYDQIFEDEEDWFRLAFSGVAEKALHIKAQSAYWIDSFGGGRLYWGGRSRLGFHHYSHHAEPVMNAKGAKRWLYHMKNALRSCDFSHFNDPRILPCIVAFLRSKVMAYAIEHDWDFDDTDFDVKDYEYKQQESSELSESDLPQEPLTLLEEGLN